MATVPMHRLGGTAALLGATCNVIKWTSFEDFPGRQEFCELFILKSSRGGRLRFLRSRPNMGHMMRTHARMAFNNMYVICSSSANDNVRSKLVDSPVVFVNIKYRAVTKNTTCS